MDYVLKVATLDDAAALDGLLQASYPKLMSSSYDERTLKPALKLMTKANPSLMSSGTYYVAELANGRVVGCGGWSRERPGTRTREPHIGHIRHFATHPAWTGRGIGRAIYQLCESAARGAGVIAFECYSSLNAEGFYGALGFKRIREIDLELQPGIALRAVLMRRELWP